MTISIRDYLERGPATSKEIQLATGLSQSSVVRRLKDMGDNIVLLQKGRSIKYAVTRNAFGGGDKLPIGLFDQHGTVRLEAFLRPLAPSGFYLEPVNEISHLLLGIDETGFYDDLPYFLYDLRPQGFLGRQIAHGIFSSTGEFPENPKRWTNDQIGRYLVANGEDLPGNLIFGEQALLRVKTKPMPFSEDNYPALASNAMKGENPGSSAGGEQPKFAVFNGDLSSHVIVKFSPKGDHELAARWRDILVTEHHAARMLDSHLFPAATSRLLDIDGRLFLETERLDRHHEAGRSPMLSLEAIDAEFVGLGTGWPQVMKTLHDNDLVNDQDVIYAEMLWLFGRLIYNTDMHLGNLSLSMEKGLNRFKLMPVYDMCSMGFAPKSGGEVLPYDFEIQTNSLKDLFGHHEPSISEKQFGDVRALAYEFWEEVREDDRISEDFKAVLARGNPVKRWA